MRKRLSFILLMLPFLSKGQNDVAINPSLFWHGESYLINAATDTQTMVCSWMKLTNLSNALVNIMTARSSDGGNTWTQVQSMPSPNSG
jgi:hypothetical protein